MSLQKFEFAPYVVVPIRAKGLPHTLTFGYLVSVKVSDSVRAKGNIGIRARVGTRVSVRIGGSKSGSWSYLHGLQQLVPVRVLLHV